MSLQTTYPIAPEASLPGMVVDTRYARIVSRATSIAAPFGRFMVKGSADNIVKLPLLAADVTNTPQGFAKIDTSRQMTDAGDASYAANDQVPIVEAGSVWVQTIDSATKDAAVYIVVGAGADQGKVSSSSGSGTLLKGAKFGSTLAAPGLVIVEYEKLGG